MCGKRRWGVSVEKDVKGREKSTKPKVSEVVDDLISSLLTELNERLRVIEEGIGDIKERVEDIEERLDEALSFDMDDISGEKVD